MRLGNQGNILWLGLARIRQTSLQRHPAQACSSLQHEKSQYARRILFEIHGKRSNGTWQSTIYVSDLVRRCRTDWPSDGEYFTSSWHVSCNVDRYWYQSKFIRLLTFYHGTGFSSTSMSKDCGRGADTTAPYRMMTDPCPDWDGTQALRVGEGIGIGYLTRKVFPRLPYGIPTLSV